MSVTAVTPLLDSSLCIAELKSRARESALAEIAELLGPACRDPALLRESLMRRERCGTTAIGKQVALPNARSLAVREARVVLARSARGLEWEAGDGLPVKLVCAVLSPAESSEDTHYELMARMAAPLRLARHRQRLLEAGDPVALLECWRECRS